MQDRHLNLFYTYNRDNELIENNLTRAWIVTLRMLSELIRDRLLKILLGVPFQDRGESEKLQGMSFKNPDFALQGNIDKKKASCFSHKYILAIASDRIIELEQGSGEKASGEVERIPLEAYMGSIPDGWIFNGSDSYCFLIESKVGSNPLDSTQLLTHAHEWLDINPKKIGAHLISLTWENVLEAIACLKIEIAIGSIPCNELELIMIENLEEYLGYFGYYLFQGFQFDSLNHPPAFALYSRVLFSFSKLSTPPNIYLIATTPIVITRRE